MNFLEQVFNLYSFLIFIVPGFITLWAFSRFNKSKKLNVLELLILCFFWGLVVLVIFEFLVNEKDKINSLLSNPFAACLVLSLIGGGIGFLGAEISMIINDKILLKYLSEYFKEKFKKIIIKRKMKK